MTTLDQDHDGTAESEIDDEIHSDDTDPGSDELHDQLHGEHRGDDAVRRRAASIGTPS